MRWCLWIGVALAATASIAVIPARADASADQAQVSKRLRSLYEEMTVLVESVERAPRQNFRLYIGQFLEIARKAGDIKTSSSDRFDHNTPINKLKPLEARWECLSFTALEMRDDAVAMVDILNIVSQDANGASQFFGQYNTNRRDMRCK